ncbi:MAG TPA: Uma2 family endonuclease [Silvibacterium sp.]|nr:Uma2 family endonuclease [Silvibacterium sp.]
MNTLEIPKLPSSLILEPALTDEEFEQMSVANELVKLERTKEGKIVVNPPTGLDSSSGNTEIIRQLANWWRQHRQGKVFDSNAGFFLPDGSSLSPDGAYATPEQIRGLSSKDRRHFGRFAPAFVIELLSASDSLSEARQKMEVWLANGTRLGWLIDPYKRNVWIYEAGKQPRTETGDRVAGTGPIEGFVLELADVWSEFED